MMRMFRNQNGDTIVEVLIAIAIISLVLGTTYGIMNRNVQILRDNQERTEATKLAQGQIDRLISAWRSGIPTVPMTAQGFCLYTSGSTSQVTVMAGVPTADPAVDNLSAYDANCVSSNGIYHVGIKKVLGGGPAVNETFKVYVRWDSTRGERKEIVYTYRVE